MTVETKKKLDSIASKEILSIQKDDKNKIDIPCYVHYKEFDGVQKYKYYIIDLTNNVKKMVAENILNDFDNANGQLFGEDWFFGPKQLKWNLNLIFIIDDEYPIHFRKIESNFNYIRKRFINEKDLILFFDKTNSRDLFNYAAGFYYNENIIELNRFNYIHGDNGTGKTMMIKEISKQFKLPIYSPVIYDRAGYEKLKQIVSKIDKKRLEYFYKSLWGYSAYKNMDNILSETHNDAELSILLMATAFVEQEKKCDSLLLLDNIFWNKYDDLRNLNIIETLDFYSNPIVVTGFNPNVKNLIKRKIYNPNIIDL